MFSTTRAACQVVWSERFGVSPPPAADPRQLITCGHGGVSARWTHTRQEKPLCEQTGNGIHPNAETSRRAGSPTVNFKCSHPSASCQSCDDRRTTCKSLPGNSPCTSDSLTNLIVTSTAAVCQDRHSSAARTQAAIKKRQTVM